ncbi:beta family protein [Roseateles sp. LKC17W]|uniref:T4 beta protein n=1 Tax=Pelomonas margarita TaxID=3299031 RepID=A0ABW7FFL1_9BURK
MTRRNKAIYAPSMRLKKGEMEGLRELRDDVADCILPVLIVPPFRERSSSSQEDLFPSGEKIPDVGGILAKYWLRRWIFIDPGVLLKEYGLGNALNWLPNIFRRARNLDVFAIPVVSLSDLESGGALAIKHSLPESYRLKLGLRIPSGDMTDPELASRIQSILSGMGVAASDCAVFADFSDADLSDHLLVAPIIRAALEQLQEYGNWQLIAFQGTHYPEKNPAKPGQTVIHPRNEWLAWRDAVKFDPTTAEHMIFGDFVADHAKLDFSGKRARPIPHCRYAIDSHWIVARGNDGGSIQEAMRNVFRRIVASGNFAGPSFSTADAYIDAVAGNSSDSAGNPSTWRQVNTTHHITRVVADIATVRGIPITELPNAPTGIQLTLLDAGS